MEMKNYIKFARFSFIALFTLMFALPSASFTYVKYVLFGCLAVSCLLILIKEHREIHLPRDVLWSVSLISLAVLISLITAAWHHTLSADTLFELRSFVLIVCEILAGILLFSIGALRWQDLAKLFVVSLSIYGLIKLLFLVFVYFNPAQGTELKRFVFPDAFMGGYVLLNGFYRLVAVNDYYLPIAYVVCDLANFKRSGKIVARICILTVIFLSFSRFLWLETVVLILVDMLFHQEKVLSWKNVAFVALGFVVLLTAAQLLGADIIGTLRSRFFVEGGVSLNYKFSQIAALLGEFVKHPVLGKGLGSSAQNFPKGWAINTGVETHIIGYSYEVFLLVILMQFGLVGSALLFSGVYMPFFSARITNRFVLLSIICVTAFFASGFTNPVIINAPTGLFLSMWYMFRYEKG